MSSNMTIHRSDPEHYLIVQSLDNADVRADKLVSRQIIGVTIGCNNVYNSWIVIEHLPICVIIPRINNLL